MPSLVQQGKNLAKASLEHAKAGLKHVSDDEYESRLEVCNACEHLDKGRCVLCGCSMKIKAKWAEQTCGMKKW
jgi:hypothetical protein